MDIITTTIITAQNQEGKMSAQGFIASEETRGRYSECISRCLLKSLGIGSITFSSLYFGQKYFTKNMKGMKRSTIVLSSVVFTGFAAYLTGKAAVDECNRAFVKSTKHIQKSN
ncbi:uncharacterized protein LOC111697632 [Eurytemora carolleeae]|uniref:uncharacterized protein LOC111697632 n=1 Tax=Eurytemora carolleeae TaxID=1294199 RepID=UPI000C76F688|nr:uncharacterized protein LOC111697632 [Eurytemora carolleeae]XP_023323468.1 uncharacterized protein LOC111697632 [Eurytemora carolleeae]XP_023323469.1 uncharacterized protein LOC111697632 [Eurytemora carolleeae]XP_023323470.1 uncharacterized protein LOC111697632 [Eurytemora carolleeae]XP_023323471.1 uncharacterized protein LOC111697632 [Eurytemora carolleeae]XP_023323472.1 uncharacterized protein LOC111697632 [Eurytemora carolleeae]|eukprot:XP_023323467.1 uncharacterized protein LOC111697632 [Eurytemora affinis]